MNRRCFLANAGLALGGLPTIASGKSESPENLKMSSSPVRMHLGCQSGPMEDEHFRFLKRHGVEAVCGTLAPAQDGHTWTVAELLKLKERVEKNGLCLEMVQVPFLGSLHIDQNRRAAIVLGQDPERERDIVEVCTLIRNCAQVGLFAIKYNLSLLGVLRTKSSPGRGDTRLSTWRLAEANQRAGRLTRAGPVSSEVFWERISYFLERVIPVATECRVRMACHPHDPCVPPGFAGVDCVLGTVDGLKKFVSICESPYHGLNFCQGTICEMLEKPAEEIFDIIRDFGRRGKIFNVHFRNIRGHRNDFQETYPDDGDIDMPRALLTYQETGYRHMIMPDHVPQHEEDPASRQAFAFCYGYIRGLLQSISRPD